MWDPIIPPVFRLRLLTALRSERRNSDLHVSSAYLNGEMSPQFWLECWSSLWTETLPQMRGKKSSTIKQEVLTRIKALFKVCCVLGEWGSTRQPQSSSVVVSQPFLVWINVSVFREGFCIPWFSEVAAWGPAQTHWTCPHGLVLNKVLSLWTLSCSPQTQTQFCLKCDQQTTRYQ